MNRSVLNFFQNVLSILYRTVTRSINFYYVNRNRICNISTAFALSARMNSILAADPLYSGKENPVKNIILK